LHLDAGVADIDPHAASLTLRNGKVIKGDVVLGADGVHSICRQKVTGGNVKPFGSGKSAFRFLIKREAAADDPATKHFVANTGELIIWYGTDRRIVMYPTSDNRLLNFVCIHPEVESEAGDDWTTDANKNALLQVYKDFDPTCLALISKADATSLKSWKLLDMAVLPTWTNDRLALLGDAAHPFLPHQGQGAGVAMEDAATLATVLEKALSKEEVSARLELYESIRYERANRIQEYSRMAGADLNSTVKMDSASPRHLNLSPADERSSDRVY
jgi:2-polyprenyl-6-methoxyphenol hydroxylase-like FAD-dependent oxidoreductase